MFGRTRDGAGKWMRRRCCKMKKKHKQWGGWFLERKKKVRYDLSDLPLSTSWPFTSFPVHCIFSFCRSASQG
jgi:hypothetical protein